MTDLRKAAEMALEALEKQHNWMVANGGGEMFAIPSKKAINELRQALAQPVDAVNISQERVDKTAKDRHEPVAWLSTDCIGERYLCFTKPKDNDPVQPLYTTPPKREWVGYTNEDRERIVPMLVQSLINHDEKTMAGLLNAILIDIEQQLKEKNT